MDDTPCGSCGTEVGATAKFCSECGTPLARAAQSAEYKQVTELFADVVHSMDIARLVGAERLREIMTELVTCASSVVQRYGGTVDKFTGDGIMAMFGAPVALEDHALPDTDNLYSRLVEHPKVLRVVALPGGYSRDDACERLTRNTGVIASFSRALTEGLTAQQSAEEFDAMLDESIARIAKASST